MKHTHEITAWDKEGIAINNLIAAAPEMYEALKILISQYEDSSDFTMGGKLTNEGFLKGKAALEKVEGIR